MTTGKLARLLRPRKTAAGVAGLLGLAGLAIAVVTLATRPARAPGTWAGSRTTPTSLVSGVSAVQPAGYFNFAPGALERAEPSTRPTPPTVYSMGVAVLPSAALRPVRPPMRMLAPGTARPPAAGMDDTAIDAYVAKVRAARERFEGALDLLRLTLADQHAGVVSRARVLLSSAALSVVASEEVARLEGLDAPSRAEAHRQTLVRVLRRYVGAIPEYQTGALGEAVTDSRVVDDAADLLIRYLSIPDDPRT